MNLSTQRLVAALEELDRSRGDSVLGEILDLARGEQFHDYESDCVFPWNDLIRRLKQVGYADDAPIIGDIRQGKYSAAPEEYEAWFGSPDGHGLWPGDDDGR